MVRRAIFIGCLVFALVYGVLIVVNAVDVTRKGSDEEQIRHAVEEMRLASLEGRDGGVLEYVSEFFELPSGFGLSPGPFNSDRSRIGEFIRKANVESLSLRVENISITDGVAVAEVPISGRISLPPLLNGYEFNFPEMQIEFKKEMRKRLLIVPDPTWTVIRVYGVSADDVIP